MKLIPRIRLRTIFLLIFCASVGLATYPDPLSALEPAIATAMVMGLLQQFRQLWLWRSDDSDTSIAFARQFALFWRAGLAAVIGSCLATALLDRNAVLGLSVEQRVTLYSEVLGPIMPLCLLIVLCNSLTRWRSGLIEHRRRRTQDWLFWAFAAALALLVIVHATLVAYLVHEAVAGIEAAIPVQSQRPGVYPNLRNEAFRPFWIAVGATTVLVLAGSILIGFSRRPRLDLRAIAAIGFAVAILSVPLLFCHWYYTSEFHRISPELAGAGLEANTVAWLFGTTLAIALVTACAYQVARMGRLKSAVTGDLSSDIEATALHESAPLLFLIAIEALYGLAAWISSTFSWPGAPTLWFRVSILWDPAMLLTLAQAAAGLQLCWIRFQCRSQVTPWVLPGLSPQGFFQSWVALALLLVIAVPTLNALGFIAWMGPFSLRSLYGF